MRIMQYFVVISATLISTISSLISPMPKGPSLEHKLAIDLLEATHHNGSTTRVITDAKKPILANDIAYFWGEENLPKPKMTSDCSVLQTSNRKGNVTICDLWKLKKCSKGIEEIVAVFDVKITFANGESPSHLLWFCPQSDVCCELACCVPFSSDNRTIIGCCIVVALVLLITSFYKLCIEEKYEKKPIALNGA